MRLIPVVVVLVLATTGVGAHAESSKIWNPPVKGAAATTLLTLEAVCSPGPQMEPKLSRL